jgi:hypothetical protein
MIPCEYAWIDEYNEAPEIGARRDGDLVCFDITGVGDGTLELSFHWRNFIEFSEQLFDLHNEVCELIDEALDEKLDEEAE